MQWLPRAFRRSDRDDLAGHHQPPRMWVLCLYFTGLNLSNRQIAEEHGVNENDIQAMTSHLREGMVAKLPEVVLDGEVEIYVMAGHKGNPAAVQKKAGRATATASKGRAAGERWRRRNPRSSA